MRQPPATGIKNKPVLPTPVNAKVLHTYLAGYNPTLKRFLIDGFVHGFRIGSEDPVYTVNIPGNHGSALSHPAILAAKIQKEISLGRFIGPFTSPPFDKFVCSPLGLIPKKQPGRFRLIHDLSFPRGASVNSSISPENTSVQYENIENVKNGRHCLMAKADIEDAFRLLCVHPDDYHKLLLTYNGAFYYDRALAMGISSVCQLFERFSSAIHWILTNKCRVSDMSHLLDDFFFVGPTGTNICQKALNSFMGVCDNVGIPIKHEKTQLPCTVITIYGIEIDSDLMIARLPQDKLSKID